MTYQEIINSSFDWIMLPNNPPSENDEKELAFKLVRRTALEESNLDGYKFKRIHKDIIEFEKLI